MSRLAIQLLTRFKSLLLILAYLFSISPPCFLLLTVKDNLYLLGNKQ